MEPSRNHILDMYIITRGQDDKKSILTFVHDSDLLLLLLLFSWSPFIPSGNLDEYLTYIYLNCSNFPSKPI